MESAGSKYAGLVSMPRAESDGDEDDGMEGVMDAGAHDLIEAVHAKDHARVKDAMRACFMACYGGMTPKG